MTISHETYMRRCIQLAMLGEGYVAPNPMVGAVLVHNNRIIGEGYHRVFGQAHAEVNCIESVSTEDRPLIEHSTMYVSLEPCSHFGKTPPCADLIIRNRIPRVVVGCIDPFPEVKGKGIGMLQAQGIEVISGILQDECVALNRRFFTFQLQHRPYIVLKWAQSSNGNMARADRARFAISNEYSRRLVHQWRSQEASILVGTNTAFFDDPELTNRFWHGPQPVRLVVDMELRLPSSLKLFNNEVRTIVFNRRQHSDGEGVSYYQVTTDVSLVHQVAHALYHLKIQSVLVEGGPRLLQSFLDEGMWDEIRVLTNEQLAMTEGIPAPVVCNAQKILTRRILTDRLDVYKPIPQA